MSDSADAVVVGGGTVGAWCAYFLRRAGLGRVVLIEKGQLGQGASSRAAGVVRMQGGTPEAVRLGVWSRQFYLSQRDELGTDSGFTEQGYLLPCFTDAEVAAAHERMAMQTALGVPVRWLEPGRSGRGQPDAGPRATLGGTFCDQDGFIAPPRNVAAYTVALIRAAASRSASMSRSAAWLRGGTVETSSGPISAGLVVLTGGPKLAAVGQLAGIAIPAGGARHQVAVTEQHPDLDPARVPMVFDLAAGLYWRPEEGGLLFGMSNPDEPPGENREVDEGYLAKMRARLADLVPVTAQARAAPDLGRDHRLHPGSPAHHRPGTRPGRRHRGQRGRGRDDVGACGGPGGGRRGADRVLRGARHLAARPRPLRRIRPQPAGHRPHRPALPGEDHLVMITATPFLATAADAKLEDWGPLDEATGEVMHTSGTTLWSGEGDQEAGVWECTAGPSRWSLADNEFVHILSGRMTVTPDGGEPADIGPGDTAVFPRGWAGTWQIHEKLRKVYVLF